MDLYLWPSLFSLIDNVQMLSHGSADLILEACTDFWDGTDIYPLSGSDRCRNSYTPPIFLPVFPFRIPFFFFITHFFPVTERKFWISISEPVCQVTAQHLPTNPCRCPCLANWMGSAWSWLLAPACSLEWSCPPPLPSNTAHVETAGALMVWFTITTLKKSVLIGKFEGNLPLIFL